MVGALTVFLVHRFLNEQALAEAAAKARIILERNLATHHYFNTELKQAVDRLSSSSYSAAYFDPVWMSSTYAVRQIDKQSRSKTDAEYYYKEAAISARSPENEADDYERAFLNQANGPEAETYQDHTRTIGGQPYFVVLRIGEVMEESCLRCHSTPANAPAQLLRPYGTQRSFGRTGEVVSAISIRIPLAAAYANADSISRKLSVMLVVLLTGLFLAAAWLYRTLIEKPVGLIRDTAVQIARDEERLGDCVPQPFGRELAGLVEAFNDLSVGLRLERDGLEKKVARRTADLEKTAADLRRRTSELEQTEADLRRRITERDEAHTMLLAQAATVSQVNEVFSEQAALLDLANEAILVVGIDSTIRYWNRGAERLYGWPASQTVGRGVREVLKTRFPVSREQTYREVKEHDRWEGDLVQVCRDGREITVVSCWALVRNDQGEPEATLEINSDVSERRAMEEALREKQELLDLQFERMPVACILWTADFRVKSWNPAAERIFGFTFEEVAGKRGVGLILPEELGSSLDTWWQRLLAREGTSRGVNKNITKDGRRITCEWSCTALRNQRGEVCGVLTMATDITGQQKVETVLREERERMARELHDSVTQSLYSLTLFGDAGRQQAENGNFERAIHYLGRISETAVQALKEMRLLVYQLRPADIENQGLVGALEHRLNAVERRAGVKAALLAECAPALPPNTTEGLYRVAQETLNNVLKHAYATQVAVRLVQKDGMIELSVTDNGLGFDPGSVPESGLGLVSMRERTERMGGTLTIQSAPHQGTTVTVAVPFFAPAPELLAR
jgi:PAS domain S-box-containing protein